VTTERPILMSAPMVRPILDGTKSQTRRVIKPQPTHFNPAGAPRRARPDRSPSDVVRCPYGRPGDRLWVREEHYRFGHWEPVPGVKTKTGEHSGCDHFSKVEVPLCEQQS
jgi:hypothetical protein